MSSCLVTMEKEVRYSSKASINAIKSRGLALRQSNRHHISNTDTGASTGRQNIGNASDRLSRRQFWNTAADNVSEDFSDIDDAEVVGYLHNEKETQFKKINWEIMNKKYLKGTQLKGARKVKKSTPAKKAVKIAGEKENKKKLSSKINYDVLKKLMGEPKEVPGKVKEGMDYIYGYHGDMQQPKNKSIFDDDDNYEYELHGDEQIEVSDASGESW